MAKTMSVKVITAQLADPVVTWRLPATVTAPSASKQAFRVGGKVVDLFVDAGDSVTNGQYLARLDPRDYANAVEQAQAGLAQSMASQRDIDADYLRITSLGEKGFIDESSVDKAEANKEMAAQSIQQLNKQLEQAKRELSYTILAAPFDGVIVERLVSETEVVQEGQPVCSMANPQQTEISAALPPSLRHKARNLKQVRTLVPCISTNSIPAELLVIGNAATPPALTYPVRARPLPDAPALILPGMTAVLLLDVARDLPESSFVLPVEAIDTKPDGTAVIWVVDRADSTVHMRHVQLRGSVEDGVVVTQGVDAGDVVVTAGIHHLAEGQQVSLIQSSRSN